MSEINIIVIDELNGQYTVEVPIETCSNFLYIKQVAVMRSWDLVKDDPEYCYYPVLSTNYDSKKEEFFIDEDLPFSAYKLHNGGIIFLHYIKMEPMNYDD